MFKRSDYLIICLCVICLFFPLPIDEYGFGASFLCRLILVVPLVLFGGVFSCGCGWKRRYESQKEYERLLALPTSTIECNVLTVQPIFKTYFGLTYTGESVGLNGQFYTHYAPGTNYQDTGRFEITVSAGGIWSIVSLPLGFSDRHQALPKLKGKTTITYVTDTSDNTRYFISASQS